MSIGVWDGLAVLVKAVLYAAALGAAGGVFFLTYNRAGLEAADRHAIRRLVAILFLVSMIGSAARVFATAGSMSGDASGILDLELLRMVWHGGEGLAVTIRAAGLSLAMLGVLRIPGVIALLGAAAAATSFAWVGHSHGKAAAWPTLLVGVHLMAAAFWLGALGPLLLLARHQEPRRLGSAAARFGAAAVAAVGALVVAGLTLLWILLGGAAQLWNSAYGRIACVKLALVAGLLACAAFNKLRFTPRLLRGDLGAVRHLRQSIRFEMALAALILIATAALTTVTGPPSLE